MGIKNGHRFLKYSKALNPKELAGKIVAVDIFIDFMNCCRVHTQMKSKKKF